MSNICRLCVIFSNVCSCSAHGMSISFMPKQCCSCFACPNHTCSSQARSRCACPCGAVHSTVNVRTNSDMPTTAFISKPVFHELTKVCRSVITNWHLVTNLWWYFQLRIGTITTCQLTYAAVCTSILTGFPQI